jgi:23S rRNA (cytidine1920-2'-O)/16S rRNA (cytidine1409-2'-O)-methyltransferase
VSNNRLDKALLERGLARSRTHARRIIEEGRARIDGREGVRPATPVPPGADLTVVDVPDGIEYASRAAHKLRGALDHIGLDVNSLRCLDAGASTGGFTDVLLRAGAREVIAVDIGHDQLAPHVRDDPRVRVLDCTSIRGLGADDVGGEVDLVVGDLSFISLRLVIADLAALVAAEGRLLLMVKPQFEVGRDSLPHGGVVTDPVLRRQAVAGVTRAAQELGLRIDALAPSPLEGQDGNREYFLALTRTAVPTLPEHGVYDMIDRVIG